MKHRMRILGITFGVALLLLAGGCGQTESAGEPRLSVQDTHEFGRISAAQQVVKEIAVENVGSQTLLIKDVLPAPPPEGG